MTRTRFGELLERKPEPHYYVAERAGRLFGRPFCTGDALEVRGQPEVDPTILREITEAEWRELVIESKRRFAEMFPEAEVRRA